MEKSTRKLVVIIFVLLFFVKLNAIAAPNLTAGFATGGVSQYPIHPNQINNVLFGLSLVSSSNTAGQTLTSLTFTANQNISSYFSTSSFVLYRTATNAFSTTTSVTVTSFNISGASVNIAIPTSSNQAMTKTTVYYWLVATCSVTGTIPCNFQMTFTGATATGDNSLTGYNYQYYNYIICSGTGYIWTGASSNNWKTANNWFNCTVGGSGNGYPGQTASTDVAILTDAAGAYSTINLNSAIPNSIAYIYCLPESTVDITANFPITVTSGGYIDGDYSYSGNNGYLYVDGTSTLSIGGTFNLINGTHVDVGYNTGGNLTFSSGAIVNLDISCYLQSYGNITTTNLTSLNMNGSASEINIYGGTYNSTSSPLNVTSTCSLCSVNLSGGTFNETTSSLSFAGNSPEINVSGGVANFLGSDLSFSGTYYNAYAMGLLITGGTVNMGGTTANSNATVANASTVELGTSSTVGQNAKIQLQGGYFNLGAYSKISILSNTLTAGYYNFYNYSGLPGVVTLAPTSVIYPTANTSLISNGNGNASNTFTLLSDASGSATISAMPVGTGITASVTGLFNVQRYISTAARNYRLLSSQTNTKQITPSSANIVNLYLLGQNATVSSASGGLTTYKGAFVGGPTGGTGFTATTPNPCVYLYDENIIPSLTNFNKAFTNGKNIGIKSISTGTPYTVTTTSTAVSSGSTNNNATDALSDNSSSVVIPAGNGYLLYYIHDNSTSNLSGALTTSTTTASGYINQGTIPLYRWGISGSLSSALTNNGVSQTINPHNFAGLTMVGNPYPSSIDLQKLYSENSGSSGVFYSSTSSPEYFNQLNPTTSNFVTYGFDGMTVYNSGNSASQYIASGEGFYITVLNPGNTLTFYEDEKTTNNSSFTPESIRVNPLAVKTDNISLSKKISENLSTTYSKNNELIGSNLTYSSVYPPKKVSKINQNIIDTSKKSDLGQNPIIAYRKPENLAEVVEYNLPTIGQPSSFTNNPSKPVAVSNLHLKLLADSINFDEIGLYFKPNSSDKFNSSDALDADGFGAGVYLSSYTTDRVRTAVNVMGSYTNGKRVPLFVQFTTSGIFQLQLEDIANIDTKHYSVFLLDKMLNDSLDLTLYKSYNFNYAPGTANDSTRFVLAIEHKPVPYYALLIFAGQKVTPGVQLNWQTKNLGDSTSFVLQKLSAANVYVAIDSLQSSASGEFNYIDQHPSLGNNTYRLEQINELGVITYSAPVTIGYNSTNPNGGLVLYPNPAKSTMTVTLTTTNTAVQVATADIYNTSGKLIEHKVVNSNSFVHDVSAYALGAYIIELKNSNGVLVGQSKFVKVD